MRSINVAVLATVRLADAAAGAGATVPLATAVNRTPAAASPLRRAWTRLRRCARVSSDEEPDRVKARYASPGDDQARDALDLFFDVEGAWWNKPSRPNPRIAAVT